MNAAEVTRTLTRAGWHGFTSKLVAPGVVSTTQRYTARGALAAADTRGRRERRAILAAEVLRVHGYTVAVVFDRLKVTR